SVLRRAFKTTDPAMHPARSSRTWWARRQFYFSRHPKLRFYFVDTGLAGAIQASPSLAVQREIRPQLEPNQNLTAFGLGAGRQLLFAAGPRIFAAQRP
ncbi:hypothetical protein EMGBS3_15220, partial [Anaerolineaceae bacterium]